MTTISMTGSNRQRAMQFQADLTKAQQMLRDRVTELYRNVIFLLFQNIIAGGDYSPGTPVDTGFARNSWVPSANGIGAFRQPSTPERHGAPVGVDSIDALQAVLEARLEDEWHLSSNCAYMSALEDGHSSQAPTGMVWLAIHAGPQIVAEVTRMMLS